MGDHQGDDYSGDLEKVRWTLYIEKGDLAAIDTAISDEDHALLLIISLPSSYNNFIKTLLYGRDTLKLEDVLATLNSRELQKMTEAKGDGGEELYVRGRSGQRDMEHGTYSAWSKSQGRSSRLECYICQSEEYLKKDCPRYNHKKYQGFVKNKDQVSVPGVMDYLVDFEEYDGGNILLGDGRECRVQGIGKVHVQMRDGLSFVVDNVSLSVQGSLVQKIQPWSTFQVTKVNIIRIGFTTPKDSSNSNLSSSNFKIIKKSFNPNSYGLAFRGRYTGGNRMNIFNVVASSIKDVGFHNKWYQELGLKFWKLGAAWFSVKENQGLLGFSGKEDSRLVKVARFLRALFIDRVLCRKNDFGLWQVRIKALLEQHGLVVALEELPATTIMA
ncbi:hypothetical protein Tco_0271058 [Tanacetum coccineum]